MLHSRPASGAPRSVRHSESRWLARIQKLQAVPPSTQGSSHRSEPPLSDPLDAERSVPSYPFGQEGSFEAWGLRLGAKKEALRRKRDRGR